MPRYPFARWDPADRAALLFKDGPAKIVHHTTEGSSIAGAIAAYSDTGSWPHFTVSSEEVVQHIDTAFAARALRNASGGVETNTDRCYQIEVVGYAAKPKLMRTLGNVARLCRWVEETHGVEPIWPNGFPKMATEDGRDPGGHNRNPTTWDTVSGHYGHCHVPENTHWDPGYSPTEVRQIMPDPNPVVVVPTEEEDMAKPYIVWNPNNAFLVDAEFKSKLFIGGDLETFRSLGLEELVLSTETVGRIPDVA